MPNAVLAQSLEDELEGSLLGNARSQFPSAAFMPSSSHFFPPLPSFQVAFTIPSFTVSLDSLEVYLEMLHLLFFRLSTCLPLPVLQMGSSSLPPPVCKPRPPSAGRSCSRPDEHRTHVLEERGLCRGWSYCQTRPGDNEKLPLHRAWHRWEGPEPHPSAPLSGPARLQQPRPQRGRARDGFSRKDRVWKSNKSRASKP